MTFFNFGRSNHLGMATIVDDDDWNIRTGYWLSGRVCGLYVSYFIPWRGKR